MALISQAELIAQEAFVVRHRGPDALTAIVRILSTPGIRTIRGLNG